MSVAHSFDPDVYTYDWDSGDSLEHDSFGRVYMRPTRDADWFAPQTYAYTYGDDDMGEEN